MTEWPTDARHVAVTRPTYPAPNTETRMIYAASRSDVVLTVVNLETGCPNSHENV